MAEDRIVEIIRKLLAKTVENGCTEEEAAAAAQKAARLMIAHDIQEEQLNPKRTNEGFEFNYGRGVIEWQQIVAGAVAESFGVACYDNDGRTQVFYGKGEKPMMAGEVWVWIVHQMYLVSLRNGIHKVKKPAHFMFGMALTVADRIADNNKPAAPNKANSAEVSNDSALACYAIVSANTANKEMHEEVEGLEIQSVKLDRPDQNAMLLGMIAGAEVPLEDNKPLKD